jgi:hypothetical protein
MPNKLRYTARTSPAGGAQLARARPQQHRPAAVAEERRGEQAGVRRPEIPERSCPDTSRISEKETW